MAVVSVLKRLPERDGEVGAGSVAYVVTKPVHLSALAEELTKTMKWKIVGGLVAEGDPLSASVETPATVWTLREVDDAKFEKVLDKHEVPVDADEELIQALLKKADDNEDLTPEEMQQAMRLILRQLNRRG